MNPEDIREFLEEKTSFYNRPEFVGSDPVQIPHRFTLKEDIEIAGFLASALAWGNRLSIIKSAERLIGLMENDPHEFLTFASDQELDHASGFTHRTFNPTDTRYFLYALRNIYLRHGGLESVFTRGYSRHQDIRAAIGHFRQCFFEIPGPARTGKHIPDVLSGSAAKRINMFLRWMVRKDKRGVDFGIWKDIPASALMLPLDVHTGNVARKLGILNRKQNDWKAVEEVTGILKGFDPDDPVKYDFALFGLGVFEKF